MDYILLDINTQIYDDGKRGFMFSFSSYFNRQSLTLIGLIVILLSLPLTIMLAQKTQQLRQRAAPSGEVIFTDANGNPLGQTTTNQDVYLKIVPPDGWTLAQNPSLLPKTYAQEETCTGGWNSATCSLTDQSPCSDYGNQTYCGWDQSLWNACQNKCAPTPSPTPVPPQPTPTPTSAPAGPISAGGCSNPAGNLGDYNSICTNQSAGCPSNAGEAKVYQCDGTNWQFKYPQCETKCAVSTPPTQPPAPTTAPPFVPVVLRQIYIQNKDGGSGGHTPARITAGAGLEGFKKGNFFLVPWKLTDGVGQKTVQVDFYEQPDNDSAGRKTATASITLTTPGAGPPAAGEDVGDCKEIKIDGVPIESANHPAIVVGKDSKITMTMRNTPPGGQTGGAAPVPTTVQTTVWGSNYSLRFIGTSGNEYDLGINRTKIDTNQSVGRGGEVSFDVFINPRPLPTGKETKEFTEFKWRMHNDKGTAFGGACSPGITVYATAPGASPSPGAPGTCPTDRQYACAFITSQLPACAGSSAGTGVGWELISQLSCSLVSPGANCYFCKQIDAPTPTPTSTPEPTPRVERRGECAQCRVRQDGTTISCFDDSTLCIGNPKGPVCQNGLCGQIGGPTPTPPPGAPTISPIPPGSTVIPIQVALQEFVPLAVPSSTQKSLIPRSKQRQINVTLAPPVGTSRPNFGPFPATVNFVSNGLFLGTVYVPPPNILPAGTNSFRVFADEPSHLQRLIATIPITTAASGGNPTADGKATPLLVGDIVHNNHIDVTDWTAAVSCLGPNKGSSSCGPYSTTADLDDDGEITIFDLNWISTNMLLCLGGSKDTFGCGGDATP